MWDRCRKVCWDVGEDVGETESLWQRFLTCECYPLVVNLRISGA